MLDYSSKLSSIEGSKKRIFNPENAIENTSIMTLPRCKSCEGKVGSCK